MSEQLELLARSGLVVQPEANRSEPRLWIRRLVIWSAPGQILRKITLRPGLNIIWAPDPADQPAVSEDHAVPGHGSGKTLLCRLLRYCLGESRFAPREQREKIVAAFPDGLVGAEVMVDGTQWAVVRPVGTSRKHFAMKDGSLSAASEDVSPTGMDPFLAAVATTILSDDVADLVPGDDRLSAWLVSLAWLARDQECRFNRPLEWRSADSDSGSPARMLSSQQHLDAVRALIGALNPDETKLRAEITEIETQRNRAQREAEHRGGEADRLRARLIEQLCKGVDDLPPGPLAIEPLRSAAIHQLAKLSHVDPSDSLPDVQRLRSDTDRCRVRLEDLNTRLAVVKSRIPEITKLISRIKGEFPVASAQEVAAGHPVCEVCEVPIDRALAEGCRLSHKLPDLTAAKRRMERLEQEHTIESARLRNALRERDELIKDLKPTQRDHDSVSKSLRDTQRMHDARNDAWYESRRLIDDVDRLRELLVEQERIQVRVAELESAILAKRNQVGSFREAHATSFKRLSQFFDAILRELLGQDATGRVSLDGSGIKLSVELGGERSTAAIDSLNVIAFDLAAMCMSIEGKAHQPAFLIHDSPREADLGLSIFHRIFQFVRTLDHVEKRPLFQYIVTTTTNPPVELQTNPWITVTLGGASHERLLRRDL